MREIKFRAWDKINKRWIADFTQIVTTHYEGSKYKTDISGGRDRMSVIVPIYGDGDYISDCELLLFTGIQDKIGVDIYEGDIVRKEIWTAGDDPACGCYFDEGVVTYEKNAFIVKSEPMDEWYDWNDCEKFDWDELEVIGNKFENPELME